jgi:GT2 family glycosyltransferase
MAHKLRAQSVIEKYEALEGQLRSARSREAVLRHAYATIDRSKFARVRSLLLLAKDIVGLGGRRDWFSVSSEPPDELAIVGSAPLAPAGPTVPAHIDPYQLWMQRWEPKPAELQFQRQAAQQFDYQPLISIVMPTYDTDGHLLTEAIDSIFAQTYANWELCIADDCSSDSRVRHMLRSVEQRDSRVKVVYRAENGHISRASNSALELCTGEFVGLLDHDDVLAPDALFEYVKLLNRLPATDMIYSDEDKLDAQQRRYEPFFKPDWSPNTFLSKMYTCHFGMYRRTLLEAIGGFRVGFEGSQDYDLVLRFTELTANIEHVPKVLYHWRVHDLSAASGTAVKPYAYISAQKALTEALARRGEPGRVFHVKNSPGLYTVRYDLRSPGLVSIVIPSRDRPEDLERCLTSIFATSTFVNLEVVLVDNGTTDPGALRVIEHWRQWEPTRFRVVPDPRPFNFSALINVGVAAAASEYVVLLNNDTAIRTADWIETMLEQAQRSSIGAVGVKLIFPDQTIQHAGIVLGLGGAAGHGHYRFEASAHGYFGALMTVNDYSAVTAACMMFKKADFTKVGGFDEELSVAYNDVDFCLKLRAMGLRNVYLPHVEVMHYESASRGTDLDRSRADRNLVEQELLIERWKIREIPDPFYNVNLALTDPDYRIAASESQRNVFRQEVLLEQFEAKAGKALLSA